MDALSSVDIHGCQHGWAMDVLNSQRIRPWPSSWSGLGCHEVSTDQTVDVIMVGSWMLGCHEHRTDQTMDVIMVGSWMP